MRKEAASQKKSLPERGRKWEGRLPLAGRGAGSHHHSCNGSMIIASGLKEKKVTFPSVPLNVTHVSLKLKKEMLWFIIYYPFTSLLNFKVVKAHPLSLLGAKTPKD